MIIGSVSSRPGAIRKRAWVANALKGGPFTDAEAASSSHGKLQIQTEDGQWTAGQVPL